MAQPNQQILPQLENVPHVPRLPPPAHPPRQLPHLVGNPPRPANPPQLPNVAENPQPQEANLAANVAANMPLPANVGANLVVNPPPPVNLAPQLNLAVNPPPGANIGPNPPPQHGGVGAAQLGGPNLPPPVNPTPKQQRAERRRFLKIEEAESSARLLDIKVCKL